MVCPLGGAETGDSAVFAGLNKLVVPHPANLRLWPAIRPDTLNNRVTPEVGQEHAPVGVVLLLPTRNARMSPGV